MLSLELAEKLKSLGLAWEPKNNDAIFLKHDFYGDMFSTVVSSKNNTIYHTSNFIGYHWDDIDIITWLPLLDQLLVEIQKHVDELSLDLENKKRNEWVCTIGIYTEYGTSVNEYLANSPEDAAAQALLWLIEQERD